MRTFLWKIFASILTQQDLNRLLTSTAINAPVTGRTCNRKNSSKTHFSSEQSFNGIQNVSLVVAAVVVATHFTSRLQCVMFSIDSINLWCNNWCLFVVFFVCNRQIAFHVFFFGWCAIRRNSAVAFDVQPIISCDIVSKMLKHRGNFIYSFRSRVLLLYRSFTVVWSCILVTFNLNFLL